MSDQKLERLQVVILTNKAMFRGGGMRDEPHQNI